MEVGQLTLRFPSVPAKVLEEKCKDTVERFNLSAQYQDGVLIITGPRPILEQISVAYQMQKMMHNGIGVSFHAF